MGVKTKFKRGFTLIEMLVVVGIIIVITGVVLANNSKFGGVIQLQTLAYDVALSVRQAQVYGIATVRFGNSFESPFGAHFDITESTGSRTKYYTFADVTPNGLFDINEEVQSSNISRGFFISQLCVDANCDATKLDVVYKRPEPDADIRANGEGSVIYQTGRVILSSPRGDLITVKFENNGQITVGN